MGWPFGGSWEGRSVQDLKEILSAIAIAINERQYALYQTETAFPYGGDGLTKTRPSPADYDGFPIAGTRLNSFFTTAATAITNMFSSGGTMLDSWSRGGALVSPTPSGSAITAGNTLSLATALSNVGLGSSLVGTEPITNVDRLNRFKGVLDQLLYFSTTAVIGTSTSSHGPSEQFDYQLIQGQSTVSAQAAWDDMSDLSNGLSESYISWFASVGLQDRSGFIPPEDDLYNAARTTDGPNVTIYKPTERGVVSKAAIGVSPTISTVPSALLAMWIVDTSNGVYTMNADLTDGSIVEIGHALVSHEDDTFVQCKWINTGDVPFSPTNSYLRTGFSVSAIIDITSQLTDQT
jgi:hypothetical protein